MTIADTPKFAAGLALLLVGAGLLVASRGSRGFNQRRQAGALMLAVGGLLLAIGLGLVVV